MSNIGEWWLTDTDDLICADGENENPNHEMVVWGRVADDFVEDIRVRGGTKWADLYVSLAATLERYPYDLIAFKDSLLTTADGLYVDELITLDECENIVEILQEVTGASADAMSVIFNPDFDARSYGVLHLDWVRISHSCFQYRTLSKRTFVRLSKALELLEEELDQSLEKERFVLEAMEPVEVYYDVPYWTILTTKFSELRSYKQPALEA